MLKPEGFQREIREREFAFCFARRGEDALAALTSAHRQPEYRPDAVQH
jgi:hypothetical protein